MIEDNYHVACIFLADRFRAIGIFTNEADAVERCNSFRMQNPEHPSTAVYTIKMPYPAMIEFLIEERLGKIHEAVMKCVDVVGMVQELDKELKADG